MAKAKKVTTADPAVSGKSGSLSKGLSILNLLADAPAPLAMTEITEALGLDNSTTFRLLQTLAEEGYVVRGAGSKQYVAGPRMLAALPTQHPLNNFRREISSSLHRLRDELGETIAGVLFVGRERVIVDVVQGRDPLSPYYTSWLKSPLHGSASGRLLLLSLSADDRRELIGEGPYEAVTPHTITDPKRLAEELMQIRAQGYTIVRDESLIGITAIGAPFMMGNQSMGCLVTARASNSRIDRHAADVVGQELANAAKLISQGAPSLRALAYAVGLKDTTQN